MKLRFSRKVLFIWGLLASFAAELFAYAELYEVKNDDEYYELLAKIIMRLTDVSPLFLAALSDRSVRKTLEEVPFDGALEELVYVRLRDASERFRDGVVRLFFDWHPRLPALMRRFGVF